MDRDSGVADLWRKGHAFALNAPRLSRGWPREYASLRAQLVRASESIPTNIVEGCARRSTRGYVHFVVIALGGASEVQYLVSLSHRLQFLSKPDHDALDTSCGALVRSLHRLVESLRGLART